MGKLGPPPQRVSYSGFHAKARVGRVRLWASSVEELSAECNVVVTTGIRGVMQFRHGLMPGCSTLADHARAGAGTGLATQ